MSPTCWCGRACWSQILLHTTRFPYNICKCIVHCGLCIVNCTKCIQVISRLFQSRDPFLQLKTNTPLAGSFPDRHCFPCRVSIQAPQGEKRYLTLERTYTSMATKFRIYTSGVFPHKDLPPQHRRERPGCVNICLQ